MSNQGTIRLKVTNGAPAIEKLWNGRFKLEFFCDNNSPKEDWYYENVSALLPEYGILQTTNFGSGVSEDWEAIPDSVYPDMRLVLAEYPYNVRAGKHYVKLTYETLTASWVEEKAEDTDYELNGLKRVSRTFVALPATAYDKVVGTSTIDSNGTTLYLGSLKIEKTDAKWSLTEMWLEAGTLSETLDDVGSQKAKVIETIGNDPSTPSGYVLASKQESDFEGFQTNRFTFLKSDVELSRTNDKVGSQLSITIEQFNGTPVTPDGYSLANTQVSDVKGIPTKRYTFLKNDVELSRSEDKVGSQLAIVTEIFKPAANPTESGYSVARTEVSDVDGIPTKRFTFLKPSIISVRQNLNNGERLVSVEAFSQTTTQVEEALSEITVDHKLISKSESDYEGIKTSTYVYQIDSSYKEEYEVNGFKRIILTELATVAFTAAAIGSAAPAAVGADLFLASQSIDNGGVIKVKESVFIEAGVISVTPMEEDGFSLAASYVYVTTNAPASEMTGLITPSGVALPESVTWYEPSVQNIEGYPTYTQKVILKTVPNGNAGVLVHSTQKFFTVTEPGVMGCDGNYSQSAESGAATRYPVATKAPRTYRKKATVNVYLTVSGNISEAEVAFSEEGVDWCSVAFDSFYTSETGQAASATGSWRSFPNHLKGNTNGQAEATIVGKYAAFANSYGFGSTTYVQAGIYRVEVDKYTRSADGTQLYLKTIVTF